MANDGRKLNAVVRYLREHENLASRRIVPKVESDIDAVRVDGWDTRDTGCYYLAIHLAARGVFFTENDGLMSRHAWTCYENQITVIKKGWSNILKHKSDPKREDYGVITEKSKIIEIGSVDKWLAEHSETPLPMKVASVSTEDSAPVRADTVQQQETIEENGSHNDISYESMIQQKNSSPVTYDTIFDNNDDLPF